MLQLLIQVFPNWLCHIEDLMRLDEQRVLACAEKRQRGECEASRGLAAPTGRCQWRQSRDTGYPQCPWIQYTALTILLVSCFCHSKGHIVSLYYLAGISPNYSTCSPDLRTCPDGYCDAIESKNISICPQDCSSERNFSFYCVFLWLVAFNII